ELAPASSKPRGPMPSAPMITPPPGEIQIRTLPDVNDAEELEPDALEEGSQVDASPAPLEAEEIVDSDLHSLPETLEDADLLAADDLKSDLAASPEAPPEAARKRLASAAALIGAGAGSAPPPAVAERPSAPPASAAALLASSSGSSVPGPRDAGPGQSAPHSV